MACSASPRTSTTIFPAMLYCRTHGVRIPRRSPSETWRIVPARIRQAMTQIRFCGEQAKRDGLQYFWVDTCCIDKSNHSELAEAITSMFRWYRNAAVCYVYLSDVSTNSHDQIGSSSQLWYLAFRKSRWFTCGWTLQELIAPQSVVFFCSNGNRLGDRKSLEQPLYEITGIAVSALQGTSLSTFTVKEQML